MSLICLSMTVNQSKKTKTEVKTEEKKKKRETRCHSNSCPNQPNIPCDLQTDRTFNYHISFFHKPVSLV